MFLALKEIKYEKLRYGLITLMIFLIAYLIFMLSSLAVGLASENTQAVNSWQTQSVVLNDNSNVSLSQSLLTKENLKDFKKTKNDSYIGIVPIVMKEKKNQTVSAQFIGLNKDEYIYKDLEVVSGRKAKHNDEIAVDQILWNRGYHNIYWWIIGGGPDEEELKKKILEAGIENNFYLLGMKKNPYPYIANADLYVQPSRYENYSVVILEAMGLCKPILATIPAAEMQIRSGENGLLCEANPESIARSIEHLYLHREEMERYVRTLKENSLEKQNDEIMDSLYRLFDGK